MPFPSPGRLAWCLLILLAYGGTQPERRAPQHHLRSGYLLSRTVHCSRERRQNKGKNRRIGDFRNRSTNHYQPTTNSSELNRKDNRMKNYNAPGYQTTRRLRLVACSAALAAAFTVSLAQPAHAAPCHTATRARQLQVRAGEHGVPRGSRHRHAELHLPAVPQPDHACSPVS